jgi:DNA repair protein RecO (recombination protein O)
MYQKYQTDAIVLSSRESGEADKIYSLYTRDFGLVRARASAVRTEGSRMRYSLQSLSLANISLVRGKRSWRIAGARPLEHLPVYEHRSGAQTFARIADLVTKLVAGEEKNEYLFENLIQARRALIDPQQNPKPDLPAIEIICVARILYSLGYISVEALDTTLFTHSNYASEILSEVEMRKDSLLGSINRALTETQLIRR